MGLVAALASVASPASAIVVASDTATPRWQSGTGFTTGRGVDCRDGSADNPNFPDCTLHLRTITTGANCAQEVITTPLSGITGSNLYPDTQCTVSVKGKVDVNPSPGACLLSATQSLTVTFTSGVNAVFNSSFLASATFTPTAVGANTRYEVQLGAGGSTSPGGLATAGAIKGSFRLTLSPALPASCPDSDIAGSDLSRGGLTTVAGGVVTVFV